MHDAAVAYETYVVDVDDIADVAPVPDFEVVVQALVMGVWNRTIPGEHEPSRGVPFRLAMTPTRREQLTLPGGPLCPHCFTPHEIAKARANDEKTAAREAAEEQLEAQRREEFFAALKKNRKPTQGDR